MVRRAQQRGSKTMAEARFQIKTKAVCREGAMRDEQLLLYEVPDADPEVDYSISHAACEGAPAPTYDLITFFWDEGYPAVGIYRALPGKRGLPPYAVRIERGQDDVYFGAQSLDDAYRVIGMVAPVFCMPPLRRGS